MTTKHISLRISGALLCAALLGSTGLLAAESQRLERAKDLIADEQWIAAIDELKAAAVDPKETNKDEALFWLAHSQNQGHDAGAAIETIAQLEREHPKSRWVKPARSLRIEIAQRLQRNDFLWYTAAPPPVPFPPMAAPSPTTVPPPPLPPPPARMPRVAMHRPSTPPPAVPPVAAPVPASAVPIVAPTPPLPPDAWIPQGYLPDTDLRIQALGSLIRSDATRVIPMLKEIALDGGNPSDGRRALFVLAQSGRADARSTVVEIARTGPEPVRIAAVRELGRVGGANVSTELLSVYSSANERVKYQVVTSLGLREAAPALMRIAQSETDRRLRDVAIVTLGQAGGRTQLAMLYARADTDAKHPIIVGLFNAQAEEELIRIAERESDPAARREVIARLRVLGTPKAMLYLDKIDRK
jgi:hypothetical protein